MVQVSVAPQEVQANPDGCVPKASDQPNIFVGWVGEKFDSGRSNTDELKPNPRMLAPLVTVNEAAIVPSGLRVKTTKPWLVTGFPLESMVKSPVTESAKAPILSRQRHKTKSNPRRRCIEAPSYRAGKICNCTEARSRPN